MKEPRSGCPINAAVEALGDHWSLIVLRDVIFGDRRYFRELQAGSIEGIASNILADRLRKLVAAGILSREDAERGARARYSLTEAGIRTLPIIVALGNWGLDWRTGTRELRIRQELLREEGPGFIDEFMDELRGTHLGTPVAERGGTSPSERLSEAYRRAGGDLDRPFDAAQASLQPRAPVDRQGRRRARTRGADAPRRPRPVTDVTA